MDKIIEVNNITKKFIKKYSFLFKSKIVKVVEALKQVSFFVKEGEVFGLLGPNGAGKTTLIKCLSTLLIPDSGNATIAGYDLFKNENEIRQITGILFGAQSGLYPKLTCLENLKYFGNLYRIEKKELSNKIMNLLKLLEIDNEKDTLIEKLSTGMKQKINLARVLLKNPKILFLDEPTLGLDPHISKVIRQFIKEELVEKRKITILLTTHYMYEAEFLCDRVAFINEGKISICDCVPNIVSSLPFEQKLILHLKNNTQLNKNAAPLSTLSQLPDIKIKTYEYDGKCQLHIEGKNLDSKVQNILQVLKIDIEKLELKKPTLEDAFIFYTGATIE
ncbi:MAG: ABC transporter ATP-binding protein [Planctomycetota bacterium]